MFDVNLGDFYSKQRLTELKNDSGVGDSEEVGHFGTFPRSMKRQTSSSSSSCMRCSSSNANKIDVELKQFKELRFLSSQSTRFQILTHVSCLSIFDKNYFVRKNVILFFNSHRVLQK